MYYITFSFSVSLLFQTKILLKNIGVQKRLYCNVCRNYQSLKLFVNYLNISTFPVYCESSSRYITFITNQRFYAPRTVESSELLSIAIKYLRHPSSFKKGGTCSIFRDSVFIASTLGATERAAEIFHFPISGKETVTEGLGALDIGRSDE